MTIKVYVSLGLVGCKREVEFEVEDDTPDEEIDELAKAAMFDLINWNWKAV